MVVNMEIISKEMIKPSTPTPHNLKIYNLSFLDQIAPSHYFPLIFFYQSNLNSNIIDHSQKSQQLKSSLSFALTKFYPLAGRLNIGSLSIECNDAGASYNEAKVHAQLLEVMEHGKIEDLNQYLPLNPHDGWRDFEEKILLAIQINYFDCGGIAIGVCMSHKIADGTSLVMFMTSWAAICQGDAKLVLQPNFDLASHYFPPNYLSICGNKPHKGIEKEKFVAKRFVFDKEKLEKLKKEVVSSSLESDQVKEKITRVEAVTAFLWKRFMVVGKSKLGSENLYVALHALNLRPRMSPPLSDLAFGNLWRFVLAISSSSSDRTADNYNDLVLQLRNGITEVNNECLNHAEKNLDYINKSLELFSKGENMQICTFSSWCRFPIYDVDFGWGVKPIWVCTTAIPFKDAVILMPTRSGDGIEAWVNMLEDEFEMLQNDEEFTSLLVH
ncbi:hypothetical protein ACH5RR_025308 [Cinchona calisaya]|uniref:Vinorine synthase n=1 Tax=Cinchona calisaya TaxID=153742 RepID=A0ABD2Z188_9GENT